MPPLLILLAIALSVPPGLSNQSEAKAAIVERHRGSREPYRFFGDRIATLPLVIYAPEGEAAVIQADLVQLTAALAVTVRTDLEVPLENCPRGSRILTNLVLNLPAVERETDFQLRFRSRGHGDVAWQSAGSVGVRVYPADLLSPIRAWAQSHRLWVEDDSGSMIQFLRERHIPLAPRSDAAVVTLLTGPRTLQAHSGKSPRDGETLVLFTERQGEVPHLVIDRTRRGTVIKVETRLLDRLSSDPLAQKLLLEIFQHLHERALSTEGSYR